MQEYAWVGDKVAFLTRDTTRSPCVMRRIVHVADEVFSWYEQATGRRPAARMQYEGRATITTVGDLPGAAIGLFGETGIEVQGRYFEDLYAGVSAHNEFDHLIFYEMGRNFWFYGSKIDFKGADIGRPHIPTLATGYAIFMRYMAIDATGAKQLPFNGHRFDQYRLEAERLLDRYVADTSLNFDNTLRVQRAPANPVQLEWTDLCASFLLRLVRVHGRAFIPALWRQVATQPDALTTQDAIDNWVVAASAAAGRDLAPLFLERWRFPVSPAARQRAHAMGPPADQASYGPIEPAP